MNLSTANIGDYIPGKGVYAGELKEDECIYQIFVPLFNYKEDEKNNFSWNEAIKIDFSYFNVEGMILPTIQMLSLIFLNKKYINYKIKELGGDILEGYFWSSTEYDYDYDIAWRLRMDDGYRYDDSKDYANGFVRPVLALKL